MKRFYSKNRKIIAKRLKTILTDAGEPRINRVCINKIVDKDLRRDTQPARTVLAHQDLMPNRVYYLETGIVRLCLKMPGSRLSTLCFFSDGEFLFIPFLELSNQFHRLSLQTVSDCVVWSSEIENFKRNIIKCNNSLWECLKIHFLQEFEEVVSMREYLCQMYNAKERYNILLSGNQNLINKAPDKYLASYIGVAPATYSRIK